MALKVEQAIDTIDERIIEALAAAGLIIENSAKHKCPVDTGNLRASITTDLVNEEKAVYVGTNVEYAAHVECGTYKQKAQPYLLPALDENRDKILKMFKGLV